MNIFDLEILQEEDFFAKAKLVIEAGVGLPPCGTEGVIQGNEILFKGVLCGAPMKVKGNFADIELVAYPPDFSEKMERLQKGLRIPPYWDALWVKDPEKWDEIQEAHPSSLYCDRRTGELKRSNWFEGQDTLNLQDNFFQDSLHMRLVKNPLKACTINVHAHWVQEEEGITSLGNAIRFAFPHARMSTYTKDALTKRWPQPGQRIGRSGVWVVKSELKEVHPLYPFYSRYSPPLLLSKEGAPSKPYRVKRHWFKPILWVGWHSRQKRKETLSLTLQHAFYPLYPGEGEHKVIEFTLQNINPDPGTYPWRPDCFYKEGTKVSYKNVIYQCRASHRTGLSFEEEEKKWDFHHVFHTPLGDPARASFFLTDRGYLAAEHAMERAKVQLAKSARAVEISFEAPWETVKDVTTDTTVTLADPRLPGHTARGKVVNYALIAKGETGEKWGRVTLLCSVGVRYADLSSASRQDETRSQNKVGLTVREDYCDDSYQVCIPIIQKSPSGLLYFRYDDKLPPAKGRGPLLKRIKLTHGPDAQEKEILQQVQTSPSTVKKVLSQNATCLRLFFKDLRTKERVEHRISVTMAASWSAPAQYCGSGNEKEISV